MLSSVFPGSHRVQIAGTLLFLLLLAACNHEPPEIGEDVYEVINQAPAEQAIDVVFFPADNYGDLTNPGNRQAFIDDVTLLINEGFYQNNGVFENISYFNFWYMTVPVNVTGYSDKCPDVIWPDLSQAAFAEVIMVLHPDVFRDCAWGNKVTSEPTSFRTAVHEASHAAYHLPDEYCCDGGYWELSPILYASEADCTGDAAYPGTQACVSFTADSGDVWWRSEDSHCDIMACSIDQIVYEYGRGDWVVVKAVLDALGPGTVNDPIVFAPASWDSP